MRNVGLGKHLWFILNGHVWLKDNMLLVWCKHYLQSVFSYMHNGVIWKMLNGLRVVMLALFLNSKNNIDPYGCECLTSKARRHWRSIYPVIDLFLTATWLMPWQTPRANGAGVASPPRRKSSTVTVSCITSSASSVPSVSSSSQKGSFMRYDVA